MSEELFEKYMQGRLSEEEKARLEAELRRPDAAAAFVEFTREWALLAGASRQRLAQVAAEEREALSRPARSRAPWVWAAAAAAAILLMILLPYAVGPSTSPRPGKVVRVEPPFLPTPEPPAPRAEAPPPIEEPPEGPPAPPSAPRPAPPAPPPPPSSEPSAPAPRPAPEPAKPPPPPPAATRVEAPVLAALKGIGPAVRLIAADGATAVKAAEVPLQTGAGVETGPGSAAVLRFPDGTRLSLAAEGRLEIPAAGRIELARGSLLAEVAPQPRGASWVFATAHAEATVLGTRLALSTGEAGTRLEVSEGRVRFTRRPDGASLEVSAGRSAEVSKSAAWQVKPWLAAAELQDGGPPFFDYAGTTDAWISEVAPERNFGREDELEVDGNETARKSLWTLLRFDVSSIPRTALVHEAVLTLHVENESEGLSFGLFPLLRPWSETEATWLQAAAGSPWRTPGTRAGADRAPSSIGTFRPAEKGPLRVLLPAGGLAVVQAWVRNPAANHGLFISSSGSSDGARFASREHEDAARRPRLSIRYQPGTGR